MRVRVGVRVRKEAFCTRYSDVLVHLLVHSNLLRLCGRKTSSNNRLLRRRDTAASPLTFGGGEKQEKKAIRRFARRIQCTSTSLGPKATYSYTYSYTRISGSVNGSNTQRNPGRWSESGLPRDGETSTERPFSLSPIDLQFPPVTVFCSSATGRWDGRRRMEQGSTGGNRQPLSSPAIVHRTETESGSWHLGDSLAGTGGCYEGRRLMLALSSNRPGLSRILSG